MDRRRQSRGRPAAATSSNRHALLVALGLTALVGWGCARRGEALVLMTVELDPELGPLVAIRLTAPGSPQATPRLIADRDIQASFRVGYYVPGADGPVTVRAEAIRISGCVVGEGAVTTTQAPRAGATIEAGVLRIRRQAQAACAEAPPGVDALETGPSPDVGAPDESVDVPVEDRTPPTVKATSPADGAQGVDRGTSIVITFSEPIDPASLTPAAVVPLVSGAAIAGTLAVEPSGDAVRFTPAGRLPMLGTIVVNLGGAIRDRAGNPHAPGNFSFRTADGAWTKAELLDRHENSAILRKTDTIGLAADPSGNAIALWEHYVFGDGSDPKTSLHARRFVPGSGWAAGARVVENRLTRAGPPSLAMDSAGRAILLARGVGGTSPSGPSQLLSWQYVPTLGWSADTLELRPSAGVIEAVGLALAPASKALAFWLLEPQGNQPGRIEAVTSAGAAWSTPRVVNPPRIPARAGVTVANPAGAVDDKGNALVLWTEARGGGVTGHDVWSSRWSVDDLAWGAPTRLSLAQTTHETVPAAQIAVDAQGNAIATWAHGPLSGQSGIFVAHFKTDIRRWTLPLMLGVTDGGSGVEPIVAMNPAGQALVVYRRGLDIAIVRFENGQQQSETSLARPSYGSDESVALDQRGRGVIAWQEFRAEVTVPGSVLSVMAAREGERGWETPVRLDLSGNINYDRLRLAVTPDGRAFVAWVEGDSPQDFMSARFE